MQSKKAAISGFIHNASLRSPKEPPSQSNALSFFDNETGSVVIDGKKFPKWSSEETSTSLKEEGQQNNTPSLWEWAFGGGGGAISPKVSAAANAATHGKGIHTKERSKRRASSSSSFNFKSYISVRDLFHEDFQLKRARDKKSIALGNRWISASGAQQKKIEAACAGISYQSYLLPDAISTESRDFRQIEKDIERTCLSSEVHAGLHDYFSGSLGKKVKQRQQQSTSNLEKSSSSSSKNAATKAEAAVTTKKQKKRREEERIQQGKKLRKKGGGRTHQQQQNGDDHHKLQEEEEEKKGENEEEEEQEEEEEALRTNNFDVIDELRRVLRAVAVRNPGLGYTQGMNYLGCMLLGLMKEEEAFWVLCSLIEDLRPHDYFSPQPRTLGGYHLDAHILDGIVQDIFPELIHDASSDDSPHSSASAGRTRRTRRKGEKKAAATTTNSLSSIPAAAAASSPTARANLQALGSTFSLFYPRWLLPLFYSELPFDTMLALWHAFFVISPSSCAIYASPSSSSNTTPSTYYTESASNKNSVIDSSSSTSSSPRLSSDHDDTRAGAGEAVVFCAVLSVIEKAIRECYREEICEDHEEEDKHRDSTTTTATIKIENPFALIKSVCKNLSKRELLNGLNKYLPRVPPPLLRRRRRRLKASRARASNASPWGIPVIADLTGLPMKDIEMYQRGFWAWTGAQQGGSPEEYRRRVFGQKKMKGFGEFKTHLSIQEEGDWMEAIGSSRVPIHSAPRYSSKKAKILIDGCLAPYLCKGSRIRVIKKEGKWVQHAKGWTPAHMLKKIVAPAQGLTFDAFSALVQACGIQKRFCTSLFRRADVDKNGFVDFPELMSILAPLRRGAPDQIHHAAAVFLLYEEMGVGLLSKERAEALISDLHLPLDAQRTFRKFFVQIPSSSPSHQPDGCFLTCNHFLQALTTLSQQQQLQLHHDEEKEQQQQQISRYLLPLAINLEPLKPLWSLDPSSRSEGGGRVMKVKIRKASGLLVKSAVGLLTAGGIFGNLLIGKKGGGGEGSRFRCETVVHVRGKRVMSYSSKLRPANSGSPIWDEDFAFELVPVPSPNNPALPLMLLLSGATTTFKIYHKNKEGEEMVGQAQCRLDQLKTGHVVEARYSLTLPKLRTSSLARISSSNFTSKQAYSLRKDVKPPPLKISLPYFNNAATEATKVPGELHVTIVIEKKTSSSKTT